MLVPKMEAPHCRHFFADASFSRSILMLRFGSVNVVLIALFGTFVFHVAALVVVASKTKVGVEYEQKWYFTAVR